MRRLLILLTLTTAAIATQAESSDLAPLPEVDHSTITYPSVKAALKALRTKPGVQISEQQGWTVISDEEPEKVFSLWSFSPPGHEAYPAVVERTTFEKDGAIYIKMDVLCEAEKLPCDVLVRDFKALNDRIKTDMQHKSQ